jgi:hypothetical protein
MMLRIYAFPFGPVIILLVCFMLQKKKSYTGCAFSSINAVFWALQMKKLGQTLLRYFITRAKFPKVATCGK